MSYSHDSQVKTSNPQWMELMPDTVKVSELSLLGTHDTMAFYGGDSVQCQSMSLQNQLESGVRVLDIRCRHIENVFAIHHGLVFQKAFFGDVLNIVKDFLAKNPSESILMRVKEEYKPAKNSRSFEDTFREHYWNKYQGYCWRPTSDNPTLGEIRGKIVILQNFSADQKFGIDYNTLEIQDQYHLNTNWDLYKKWEAVKAHLARATKGNKNTIYMNYLSGSGGSFPYFVASGHSSPGTSAPRLATGKTTPGWKNSWKDFPRVNCFIGICTIAFEGTNILAANWLGNNPKDRVGIVMADFPGPGLIERTISRNSAKPKPTPALIIRHTNRDTHGSHPDSYASYKSWGGGNWNASIDSEGTFTHTQQGAASGHTSTIINYITWDESEWTATIDPASKLFTHTPKGASSPSHTDTSLNYLTWDGSAWTMQLQ